ncbi:MAG: hypothetical protein GY866_35425 [Proteobacteria bacterium]|nr:hypothetical protein [Pseudomonadota bacterium]
MIDTSEIIYLGILPLLAAGIVFRIPGGLIFGGFVALLTGYINLYVRVPASEVLIEVFRGSAVLLLGLIFGGISEIILRLKRTEVKFRTLIENYPDIILNVDRHGTILFVNENRIDSPAHTIVGQKIYDFIGTENKE